MREESCRLFKTICSFFFSICNFNDALCNFDDVLCNFDDVLCNFDDVLCKVDDTLCNFNDALCNIDDALCNIDDALCNFNNALCNFNDALCKSDRIFDKLQCANLLVLRASCAIYRLDIRFNIISNIYQSYIIFVHGYIAGNAGVTQKCFGIDYGEIFGFEIGI